MDAHGRLRGLGQHDGGRRPRGARAAPRSLSEAGATRSLARSALGSQLLRPFRSWATIRFAGVGVIVAAWMFAAFAVLNVAVGLHPQASLGLAYASGLAIHFVLNRQWVFSSEGGYVLHLSRQGRRYLLTVGTTYALSALSLFVFSGLLGANPLVVYYGTAGLFAAVTFLVFQRWVFRSLPRRGGDAGHD